ncbi:uncharacterized protein LOC143898484 isoform X1 [Temnothorax americanus]|uniref:uncharacterized protein LOC143898484 isoform X1 n=1 Tax=Temnothorax americanus TaxID=1964332 RepID=UPI00406991B6
MVICKFYRQGNCRYGQYCQYEHINHFGNTKNDDDIVILVAKEVLLAERGGQWLLSCFAPLKERPCIPDMEDLSPEEVRWEIYHAQKNGMVEQAKLHYQQLCQDMKAKREMLKNPSRETISVLKKLLGSGQKGGLNASNSKTAGKSSALSFAAPQLNLVNNTSTNNVFGNASFGVQSNNPFGGGGFTSSSNASSIFGKSNNNNNTTSVFGGATNFGNNIGGFGTATSGAGSIFGTPSTSTSFSGVQNSAPTFGTPQNNPVFGGTSQNVFGQNNNVFGGTAQLGNAPTTSLFNNPTSQANTSLFGGATTTAPSLFGGSAAGLQTNSVFGVSTSSSSGSFNGGVFTQPKSQVPAFGGAPVFAGVTPNYANNPAGNAMFGGGQTFGAPAISTSGIFGGSTVTATPAFGAAAAITTPAFGTSVVSTTSGFGASVATTAPAFDLNQQPSNNTTFGTTVSAPNVFGAQNTDPTVPVGTMSFGAPAVAISGPFVTTSSQQFDSTSVSSAPFAGTGFGVAVPSTNSTFGTTETASQSIFANVGTTFATSNGTVPNPSLFPAPTFGNVNTSSPFGPTAGTTPTSTTANPFAPRMQQGGSPFGIAQNQSNVNASPFGKSPFNTTATSTVIDETIYSVDSALTDDEKNMFLAEKFIIGKIPLKPPTKDIR